MSSLRSMVAGAFRKRFGREPTVVVRAPGRVNLLGAHVDYNEGWVLPAAIDRSVILAAASARAAISCVRSLDFDDEAALDLRELDPAARAAPTNDPRRGWADYPSGVAWALRGAGHDLTGIDAVFASDVPIAAGMSSSAAVEVAFLLAWERLSGLSLGGAERARLARTAENKYVGVASGIMDQYASLHGRADHLVHLDCRTLEHDLVPVPAGAGILVADSGVRRELAGSEYNTRPRECHEALSLLQRALPGIRALRDVSAGDLEQHAAALPAVLARRTRHVVEECARVLDGVAALREGDVERFGGCIRSSHESSRDLYEVSVPELDVLAEAAWAARGCHGARLTGAGFGGCVACFVDQGQAGSVADEISRAFAGRFGRRPSVFSCRISDGAAVEVT